MPDASLEDTNKNLHSEADETGAGRGGRGRIRGGKNNRGGGATKAKDENKRVRKKKGEPQDGTPPTIKN